MDKELIDRAWRILPAEFKRIVKAHYAGLNAAYKAYLSKDSLTNEECDRCKVIREKISIYSMYFGKHNLTSDAEGEDEVLTVSRKRVQELYSKFDHAFDNVVSDNLMGHYRTKMGLLKALFGSKCLPDEACNIASSDVASTEPNPAEPKFKHGDMVIYKRTGKKKVVSGTDKYGRYIVVLPNNQSPMYVDESDLEPYTEPTANYLRSEGALNTAVLAGNYSSASTCDKQFDNIIKDGFKNHNRLHIAAILAAGMLASEVRCYPVDRALELADALIDKCEKGVNNA